MITLDLAPHEQAIIETQSQQMGVSIEQYIKNVLFPQPETLADGIAIQQQIRNDNPMIAKALSLPKPTSYHTNAVDLQREWRNEW